MRACSSLIAQSRWRITSKVIGSRPSSDIRPLVLGGRRHIGEVQGETVVDPCLVPQRDHHRVALALDDRRADHPVAGARCQAVEDLTSAEARPSK